VQDLVLVAEVAIKLWLYIAAAMGGTKNNMGMAAAIKNNMGGLHNMEVRWNGIIGIGIRVYGYGGSGAGAGAGTTG
jgi:hypothetical protein